MFYHLFFLGLAVLAVCFYKERLFGDGALDIFCVINRETFCFTHRRIILFFSQWMPLIGIKLNLPLKQILILYSLGHIVFYYALFLISHYGLRDKKAGIAYLLTLTISDGWPFFAFPMSEIQYGIALIILLWSIANLPGKATWLAWFASLVVLFFILTSHPLIYYVLLAVFLLFMRDKPLMRNPKWLASAAILFCVYIYAMAGANYNNFQKWNGGLIPDLSAVSPKLIWKYLAYNWQACLLLLLVLVYYFQKQDLKKCAAIIAAFILPLIIFSLHPLSLTGVPQVYVLVLAGLLIIPATYILLEPGFKYRMVTFTSIIVIGLCGFLSILWQADFFVHQKKGIQSVFESLSMDDGDKYLLHRKVMPDDQRYFYNPPLFLSMLYSASGGKEQTKVIQVVGDPLNLFPGEIRDTIEGSMADLDDSTIIAFYANVLDREVFPTPNPRYFRWSDKPYTIGTLEGKNSPDSITAHVELDIILKKKWYIRELFHGRNYINSMVVFRLENGDLPQPLYSNPSNGLEIRYLLTDKSGRLKFTSDHRLLICDVHDQVNMPVKIQVPGRLKNYTLAAELLKDGQPLGIGDTLTVHKRYFNVLARIIERD